MKRLVPDSESISDVLTAYDGDRTHADGRCWVMANMVGGLDGTAAAGGRVAALSTPLDFELFNGLRSLVDVVLVGAETVRRERYGPVRLSAELIERRASAGLEIPRIAIVSRSLDLAADLPVFDAQHPPLVFTGASSDVSRLSATAEVIIAGDVDVDLHRVIDVLGARSVRTVLCEGGPTLLGDLVAADLLDEYFLTITPVVGGDEIPIIRNRSNAELRRFQLQHVLEDDG
ncbi:MAG: hypothetical protein JWL72_4683, partial [Ilumatobacteraceae bacterium]|nr:hypothetical protein [Ilumatobacteraceae bacterium]